jgi:hypothetical protein
MPGEAFRIDVREVVQYAQLFGSQGVRIVGNELGTAMDGSLRDTEAAVNARVHHKTGNYKAAMRRLVSLSGAGVLGTLTNAAASKAGFVYAWTLEFGRGPVHAIKAKALRFEIGGQVFFRKSVGPAPAQHPMEFGLRDAQPRIEGRFAAARDRIAARLEAL